MSLLLIAVGAILAFAVTGSSDAVDVPTVGWIVMAAGLVGLVLSLIMWDSWAGGGYWRRRRVAYPAAPPPGPAPTRRRVVEEEVVDDAPPPAPPP